MALAMADNAAEVFVYTGEGAVVPKDVVRVLIDPSVLAIPEGAFIQRYKLEEVELHDGLREIGYKAFIQCLAFRKVQLSDGVERIGEAAFSGCRRFTKFRSPLLVTTIPVCMLLNCSRLFSFELPENIIHVGRYACHNCRSLRNIALAFNTVVENAEVFRYCWELLHIFNTEEAIVNALRNRFNGLPVHSKMYYISYYPVVLEEFCNTIMSENGELHPTGLHQDCLGMTPLHILACSTVQLLELYRIMIEKYPESLIVEDAWGATPLLYAIWGDAPNEIVEFLVKSYQSLYPNHEFDWNDMVITLGKANAAESVMQNLLDIQHMLSPMYSIDWDQILGELSELDARQHFTPFASSGTFCFLIRCSIATRVNAIGVKHFRDAMTDDWMEDDYDFNREEWHAETVTKLEYYESEYRKLKEMTSLLELALWKIEIDNDNDQGETMGEGNNKLKMDQLEFRRHCRISCGADHVVENVWPYLLPTDFVRSYVYVNDEDDEDEIEDVDNANVEDVDGEGEDDGEN
jgi:hypothetical protein